MMMLLEGSGTPISWEVFKQKFYTEYFPNSVRFAKEVEFLELVQGNMTVSEYADRKFENRLIGDIKLLVTGLCMQEFPALVDRARVLEKTKFEVDNQGSSSQSSGFSGHAGKYGSVSCYNYGGPHVKSVCPQLREYRGCNQCGKEGHFERDCPMGRRTVVQNRSVGRFQSRRGAKR
ncbi:uncharacterized protein LOC124841420 [Vigna umbellata]|uniref:uncharacterized protein LOC124841420 n=1 Tax=Vigna umbellata TaxID=87088 RepID=UPI001F5F7BEB|nr:uncharacterized protein LOC124841420 [Vigna umbellata]